jgi:hypothetical protein
MDQLSYRRHRFPPPIIQHAIWLYLRFTLNYRDVEELLAERGLEVSYETVRRWVLKFGPGFARRLRRSRPRPSDRWHLDEMVVRRDKRTVERLELVLWHVGDAECLFRSPHPARIQTREGTLLSFARWPATLIRAGSPSAARRSDILSMLTARLSAVLPPVGCPPKPQLGLHLGRTTSRSPFRRWVKPDKARIDYFSTCSFAR